MTATFKHIVYSISGSGQIAIIKLNRPASANSTTPEVYAELARAFLMAEHDKGVIITYLTGEGRFFSAGADVNGDLRRDRGVSEVGS
jgi:enoyl-CoA hydratase/carnithine racemase